MILRSEIFREQLIKIDYSCRQKQTTIASPLANISRFAFLFRSLITQSSAAEIFFHYVCSQVIIHYDARGYYQTLHAYLVHIHAHVTCSTAKTLSIYAPVALAIVKLLQLISNFPFRKIFSVRCNRFGEEQTEFQSRTGESMCVCVDAII